MDNDSTPRPRLEASDYVSLALATIALISPFVLGLVLLAAMGAR